MRKIAIFASGPGESAGRVASLFNEGDRVRVEVLAARDEDAALFGMVDAPGVTTVSLTPDREEALLALLAERGVELVALDGFTGELPAGIAETYAGKIITLTSAEDAPREVLAAFSALDRAQCPELPSPSEEGEKNVDEEWAETLKMNYDTARLRSVPPPIPGGETRQHGLKSQPSPSPARRVGDAPSEPMPPTHLIWAILATVVCCLVPGVVAIIFSSQVSTRYFSGDVEGARRASRNAEIWIIVSFVLGLLSATLYLPIMLIS